LIIEPFTIADLDWAIDLEKRVFAKPWSKKSFLEALANPQQEFFVAKTGAIPLGYLGAWRMYDTVHITNIAVEETSRRQGVATGLLAAAEAWAASCPLTLEVRLSNYPARALYEKFGFQVYGARPGYYEDNGEDALILWKGV
jgi:ribosomal-protein-alanine N-acetyltransferase